MELQGGMTRGKFASDLGLNLFCTSNIQKLFLCIYNTVIELNNK
jgi:hypothetical protein